MYPVPNPHTSITHYLTNLTKLRLSPQQNAYFDDLLQRSTAWDVNGLNLPEGRLRILPSYRSSQILPKECYRNALLVALSDDLEYWEGYYLPTMIRDGVQTPLIPMEHAWNVDPNGKALYDYTDYAGRLGVISWFGIRVPNEVLARYVDDDGISNYLTPLQFMYRTAEDNT